MLRLWLVLLLGGALVATGCEEETPPADESDDGAQSDDDGDDDDDEEKKDDNPATADGDDDDGPKAPAKDAGKTPAIDAGKISKPDAGSGAVQKDSGADDGDDDTDAPKGGTDAGGSMSSRTPKAPGAATMRSVMVGSAKRTYLLYVPSGLDKATPVPMVSVHHGFTMSGKIMEDITTWKAVAEREGIVVAFPDGGGASPWNVGEGVCNVGGFVAAPTSQDDLGFVKQIIEDANGQQAIDKAHVFLGGFSMGGYFADNVGCKGRDYIRAVAAHSGGTYPGSCPGKPIPVLVIHGDSDTLIPPACGKEAYGYWVTRNMCGTTTKKEEIKNGSCEWNEGCPEGQEVGICLLKGMDHGWSGATGAGAWIAGDYGGGDKFEDAAEMMWRFFKKYL